MRLVASAAGLAAAFLVSASAQAAVLVDIFDDFEGYGDQSVLNFTSFADLTVADGAVDFLRNNGALATPYGTGFLDLDGSANDGGLLQTGVFDVQVGDVVTFEFDYAGNRRGSGDMLDFGVRSTGFNFLFDDLTLSNGITTVSSGGLFANTARGPQTIIGHQAPWTRARITFTAGTAGSIQAFIGTPSADNQGPLIDNFSFQITRGVVPEPAAWVMMIGGFGAAGAMLRRRKAAVAA